MNGLGLALAFGAPAALLALAGLAALVWLLRRTPPKPRIVDFPPTALLADLVARQDTPARTPWWLIVLRTALVGLLILALARPVLHPGGGDDGRSGPLWLLVDDGWPAAARWPEIAAALDRRIETAAGAGRPVLLLGLADGGEGVALPQSAAEVRARLAVWRPHAWAETRPALLPRLAEAARLAAPGSIVWLASGIDLAPADETAAVLAELRRIAGTAPIELSLPADDRLVAIAGLEAAARSSAVRLVRPADPAAAEGRLAALDRKGRRLADVAFRFAPGEVAATATIDLPLDLRNEIARLEVVGEHHAGAVALTDDRWRRRAVGLLSAVGFDRDRPLLAPDHYLEAAVAPFADLRRPHGAEVEAGLRELIDQHVSMLVLADVAVLSPEANRALLGFVEGGGLLLRFAGPRLAASARPDDPLLPVALRRGERTLGGALAWTTPRGLGPFAETGPFAGLTVPADVRVSRQILAEPSAELSDKVWASLDDGTPLVTAAARGRGRVVLVHVGADTDWSDLPLSGTFVEMLRRLVDLSGPAAEAAAAPRTEAEAVLAPETLLDGFGTPAAAGPDVRPIAAADFAATRASRAHPPGLWGRGGRARALPTLPPDTRLAPLAAHLDGADVATHRRGPDAAYDAAPSLLVAALLLALLDGAIVALAGLPARLRRRLVGIAVLALAGLLVPPPPAEAADAPPAAIAAATRAAALAPRLAHVTTGDAALDDLARRGLAELSRTIADRTAFEPAEPVAVDPAVDDLSVYPLLYWPISPTAAPVPPRALARLDAYLKTGGTVLFDTRDADDALAATGSGRRTPAGEALRRLVAGLDLPPLEPVPADHVLGRTFYLLSEFPGRFDAPLWVEATPPAAEGAPARPARPGDGVSPVLITGADLAGAWARDDADEPMLPMAVGDPRGRETALRVGVNLVMYVLTGNYKADQVHVPALLERLGR